MVLFALSSERLGVLVVRLKGLLFICLPLFFHIELFSWFLVFGADFHMSVDNLGVEFSFTDVALNTVAIVVLDLI